MNNAAATSRLVIPYRSRDGRLCAHWGIRDELDVLFQVGALEPPTLSATEWTHSRATLRVVSSPRSDGWDPGQYGKFAAERAQPFWDLIGLIEGDQPIRRAVDLGCGTGELTAAAAEQLEIVDMVGIDSSPNMLAAAAEHARPGLRFEQGDLAAWPSQGHHDAYDLVLANASLQWVPDHVGVVTRWWRALAPGGQLAVQVPANADHPSHRIAAEVAAGEPFRTAMGGHAPPDPVARNVLAPEQYAILLNHLGAAHQHVRLQVYGHVLARSSDVVEWVKGTSLTRFVDVLPDELRDPFVAEYRSRLLATIGDVTPYFYPFKRIVFWGRAAV